MTAYWDQCKGKLSGEKPTVMRWLICIVVLQLCSLMGISQSEHYSFSKLDTYNGLSNNQVSAILKDGDGFLWVGTSSGLNRYDGHSCKVFRKNPLDSTSLKDDGVTALYELPGNKIWVTTRGGNCIYDPGTEKFDARSENYLLSLGLPAYGVSGIVKGHKGRYWFLYGNELYLFPGAGKKAEAVGYRLKQGAADKITAVQEANDDHLWLVYQNGYLQNYDIQQGKVVFSSDALQRINKENKSFSILPDKDGDIWIWSFSYGLFLFHPGNGVLKRFDENSAPSKLSSNLVFNLIQDKNGLIWVATDHGGVTLIDKKAGFSTTYLLNDPKDPKSLSQNSITALYKDDDNGIWLGTYKHGVNYLNSDIVRFSYYHHEVSNSNSLQYDDINRFAEDKWGNIWMGTNGGGLIYFNRKNNTFKQYLHDPGNSNSLSSNVIVSLWIDHKGIVWIGTYLGGLNSFDGNKFTRYTHNSSDSSSLSNNSVWEIFEDSGKNLWIGTLGGGLDLLDRATGRFRHYQYNADGWSDIRSNFISALMQDRKGNLWIGTDNGVAVFDKDKKASRFFQHSADKNSLSSNNVICLSEDDSGRIWVGTREGLNLYREQTGDFQVFTASDGLPDNIVFNIIEDNYHAYWISTPSGLCKAIPKQRPNGLALFIVHYDEANNLQSREFNENAALKTRDGNLLFGGPGGFNMIDPNKITQSAGAPKLIFTGLQIFNNNIEPGMEVNGRVLLQQALSRAEGINLKYKENVFSIEFSSLDFVNSNQDRYAYMLEGFNPDWLYANSNQRRVTYTNLDPGHYVFKIRVLNGDGLWSDIKSLQINIEPPFWRTPLAYIVYLLMAAGLFLLIRRITLDRIHMRFEMQQQRMEVERVHAIEQLKTKFFTNVSHEFRTPLSLIITPLDKIIGLATDEEQKKQLNLVQRNAKRLLNLVNQLLDFRKLEVQALKLHPAIGDIVQFCRDISLSFTDMADKKDIQFSFSANIDHLEIYFDKDKIEKVLFNLLSNAFKYTRNGGTVGVRLLYHPGDAGDDGRVSIEVEDTGIGIPQDKQEKIFERFFQTDVPESMVNQGTGLGLAIAKEFVRLHNGVITVTSEPEKGSCFTVLLPVNKIHVPTPTSTAGAVQEEEEVQETADLLQKKGKKKTIVIVEDNEYLRFYLKDNLKGQYHVVEATNGKEGWEKIKTLHPDLVVSDVMMPLMNGIELTEKIKTETRTSHIPVILLTAKGSEDKQLEGFKIGANDYIIKPFTFEILASRIRNLLAQQKVLQMRFQKQMDVNPAEVTITPVDEKFLKQALEVVEKNINNPEFTVEDFSRDMFMNRVTLYRKVLSLTGKTPIELIRSIRLKRAAQLLEKSGMSIAEIAYEVGFNNPKHFSRFFKDEFGVLPSQYMANRNAEKNTPAPDQ